MSLSERQVKILYSLIQEHIKTAKPVASASLTKKCKFGFSPATIRNEFAELEENGFLEQPYTSAGRVPTSKAYRYFVDHIVSNIHKERQRLDDMEAMLKNFVGSEHFNRHLIKSLADASNSMALGWVDDDENDDFHPPTLKNGLTNQGNKMESSIINQEKRYSGKSGGVYFSGFRNILREPEFEDNDYYSKVGDILDRIDDEVESFMKEGESGGNSVRVFIGPEVPIRGAKDFSLIVSSMPSKWGNLKIAIFGPQRMDYEKNLQLIAGIKKLLE